ncbi:hypothetical protein BC833DRAFT_562314 [Globomyces pollinis-pini]|nr:hypothetical protein BC833DRAFT_562314 [Globomyces pollinis-pini]
MKLNITEQELTKQRQADTQNKQLINDLKSRNELLESDISHLHQITKQMKDQFDHERKALNESVRLNEKLKDNENFHDHEVLTTQINELEDKLKSQHRIVMELVDKNQENENVIAQKSKKLEKLKKQNILLAEKSDKMEIELEDVLQRYLNSKREYDSLHKWTKVYRNIVDDYEDAVQATELFADPSKRGMADSKRPLLGKHVHKLLKDRKELYSTVVSMERDIQELQMKLDNSTQKHALELDQKKQQLSRCKESLKAAESLVIDIKQRFQETSHLLHKTELKCNSLEDEKRAIVSKYEENETDLLEKYNYKHRELRERFDDERCQLRCQIDNLQKEKVDLQAEIGQCLRDRRSYTNAYYKGSAPLSKY